DWRPAMYLGVLDCAQESNSKSCNEFGVLGYPTLMFFNTYTRKPSDAIKYKKLDREPKQLRRFIIDNLEAHKESPPPACPPLEPISAPEVDYFFENNDEAYLVLIFEQPKEYMAREVAMDMVQYQGVSVRRVLQDQTDLVERFKVTLFPTGFILCRNGSISRINPKVESREQYRDLVRALPGVKRVTQNLIGWSANPVDDTVVQRTVNSSAIYMADLESSIHYSLRVEIARYSTFNGDRLKALINYVSALNKYFPARPYLSTLLESLYSWLYERRKSMVLYKDLADVVNSKDQEQNAVLTPHVNYVWCQGSKPEFRGFPCSVWTLFHLLTVRAAELESEYINPQEVLRAMRSYVRYFFGCRHCAEHFEEMAKESMSSVRSREESITWLWASHNRVNKRLAELCPDCQEMVDDNVTWVDTALLSFMKKHFAENNLSHDYLEDEAVLLENQRKATSRVRTIRAAEDEETDSERQTVMDVTNPPVKAEEPGDIATVAKGKPNHTPTIIKMKSNAALQDEKKQEDILDLDSVHMFPRRTLQDSNSHKNRYVIQPERMLDLPDSEFDPDAVKARLLKRGVDANSVYGMALQNEGVNWKGRWVRMLEVGFSRLDISICVILYFLTTMCLLSMYLYLNFRSRLRQRRGVFP
ncbi:hypothetical protein GDO78_009181, partial [Eleutherodactylus coqui]